MHKKHKYDILVIMAVFGFAVSLYLAISHYMNFSVPCTVTKGCETVLSSKYAYFLGLPLSVWGCVYFVSVIITALMANHYKVWRYLLTYLVGVGALCSLVFLSIQFFVIKKVCQYCLTVDLLSIVIFLIDINIVRTEHEPILPPA